MQTYILKSDNKAAMKVIKAAAKEMKITLIDKTEEETSDYYYINGARIKRGKGKLDVEKNAGSLSHIYFEDPKIIREKAWRRKKSEF